MVGSRELKKLEENISSSGAKGEEDCGGASIEIFKATVNPEGASSSIENELHEVIEFQKKPSEPATWRGGLLSKLRSHWSKRLGFRKEKPLDRQTVVAFNGYDRGLPAYIKAIEKERKALALEVGYLRERCNEAESLENQLNQVTVERDELVEDREALMDKVKYISDVLEAITEDREDLKHKLEKLRRQSKDAEVLQRQLDMLQWITESSEMTENILKMNPGAYQKRQKQ
jgi:DNA repair exonuclease SbcCD ATPase subunit